MRDQGRLRPYEQISPVKMNSQAVAYEAIAPPPPLRRSLLDRGRDRYSIHCAVCHDARGEGHGFITERGYPAAPSLHLASVRSQSLDKYVQVMVQGKGIMPSFSWQLSPHDRWAVAFYIRALQVAENLKEAR
jgi:mono/diheme cytochrome c family protein